MIHTTNISIIYTRNHNLNVFTINPETKEIVAQEMEMKANTVYSFFNSILIDELGSLNQHTIYCDTNALSNHKKPFFLGEQLIIGDALIVGLNGMEEVDVTITLEQLKELVSFDVNPFYTDVLIILADYSDVNLYRSFEIQKDGESIPLNIEWVLYTFNMADEKTQNYFITELMKAVDAKEDINLFMQKMATLAINAAK